LTWSRRAQPIAADTTSAMPMIMAAAATIATATFCFSPSSFSTSMGVIQSKIL
jgi:hypothetical protein